MISEIGLKYDDIVRNEKALIEYLAKNSDSFSIVVTIDKSYSQNPPVYHYSDRLNPYATEFLFDKKDWRLDFLGSLKHQIMVICRSCKGSRKELSELPNLFVIEENVVPEDICFYRGDELLFATITHEKMCFMQNPAKQDLDFLKEHNIKFYNRELI